MTLATRIWTLTLTSRVDPCRGPAIAAFDGMPSFEDRTPPIEPAKSRSSSAHIPAIGTRIGDGRYEVMEVLGEGGMSTVLGAFDRELERPVAIKVLHDDGGRAALLDEGRMLAAAQSGDVVAVFALHLDAVPPFLVMERVYGVSLDKMLDERTIPFGERMQLLSRIAKALDVLHAHGIAHGDVKAGNVLVDRDGTIKLADLGIMPLLRRASSGDVLGTPRYMPPERARGLAVPDELHLRGDVYSFAVLAFIVLAGRPPFMEEDPHDLLRLHASAPPPLLSTVCDLSPAFDAVIAAGLAKDPLERPTTAGVLMRALERAIHGVDGQGHPHRVLIVDDDDGHRELNRTVLAAAFGGAILESARDGTEALARITEKPPRLLVVDLSMPGMSGITLLERAVAVAPDMQAIVLTGEGSGKERQTAAALGVHHFLIKPVEHAELARCVAECFDDVPDHVRATS